MTGNTLAYVVLLGAVVILLLMYNRARGLLKWVISTILLSVSLGGIAYFIVKLSALGG